MLVDVIAGARPNFMKVAPIIHAIQKRKELGSPLRYRLVHTGQHYDAQMSENFFVQLGIPHPDVNLSVGSGSQAQQTAAIMLGYERVLVEKKCDLCLVVGDVTSTMACAITAQKLGIPVAHVEAGLRSGDWTMPEEINRLITDSISNHFFTTSEIANENLLRSGVPSHSICFVGNTMIDSLIKNKARFSRPAFFDRLNLANQGYFVMTLHRPANVDKPESLKELINHVGRYADSETVLFPVHPRTRKILDQCLPIPRNVVLVEPQPYLQFSYILQNARGVITDSGGVTEEATVLSVPCMTLREATERPETVIIGTNELVGNCPRKIKSAFDRIRAGRWKSGGIPPLWDGKAGERIVAKLETLSSRD